MLKSLTSKYSLYTTLGVIIISTVVVIMALSSTYDYVVLKNKILAEMMQSSKQSIVALEKNVKSFMASYDVNEYDKLINTEMEHNNNLAIIVEDYNMGRILGKDAYVSGKIRDVQGNIVEYNDQDSKQNEKLKNSFYSERYEIINLNGERLGAIGIYISSDAMDKELNGIIIGSLLKTIGISLLLILTLLFTIRIFLLRPLSNIIGIINNSDEDGLPVKFIPQTGSREIVTLSNTMNNMISTIKDSRVRLTEQHIELKDRENQLHRSQRMDALGKLTGGIAHDYNNMLGVILGYAEMLQTDLSDNTKLVKYANEIFRAGERGAKLTRKLLSFTGKQTTEAAAVDINGLLRGSQLMLEKTLTASIRLILDLDDDLYPVWVDGSDLEDAVLNISINAMHAMSGGGQLTITTSNSQLNEDDAKVLGLQSGNYALLSLTDTGIGMDEMIQNRIFDPFFSTKGDMGTGLGLSQVYGFLQRSKGVIKVYSELCQGTRFTLYFPCYQDINTINDTEQSLIETDQSGHETILVVDDEPGLCDLTELILSQQGYRVLCVENAKQALAMLETERVDLLLSDVIMPDMNGYQLSAKVREYYPAVKIQLASGFGDNRHQELVSDELRQQMLQKPFNSQVLLKHIRTLLDAVESQPINLH